MSSLIKDLISNRLARKFEALLSTYGTERRGTSSVVGYFLWEHLVMCQFQIRPPRQRHARWRITSRENECGRRKRHGRLAEAARRRLLAGVRQTCAAPRGRWVRRQVRSLLVKVLHGIPRCYCGGKINIVCASFQALRPPCGAPAGNPWHLCELILKMALIELNVYRVTFSNLLYKRLITFVMFI